MSGSVHKDNVTIAGSLTTTGAVTMAAGSVAQSTMTATAITPAADGAVAILNTTTEITLNSTTGAKAITTTSSFGGQQIYLRAATVSGGSYTLAVTDGTLTLNSAGEAAIIQRNVANDAWIAIALTASSSTGANIATIV